VNRFNLTFKGEILTGKDPERARLRFAELFGIDDPVRLEYYFSGETIVLREDLDTRTAAEYFSKLREFGVEAELVKITGDPEAETKGRSTTESARSSKSARPSKSATSSKSSEPSKSATSSKSTKPSKSATSSKSAEPSKSATSTETAGVDDASQAEINTTPSSGQVGQRWAVSSRKRGPRKPAKPATETTTAKPPTPADKGGAARGNAREKAAREKAKRKAPASARRKASEAARRKASREEAARERALAEEVKREAEEEKRRKAEEAARRKAQAEEAKRKAEEEKRRKAEEAARRKAQAEEAKREAEEEKRRKAEEAARRKALAEEARRKAEEEKRRKAEEAARRKAQAEEARRKADEEKRRKAEEAARRKAQAEEARRKAEEEKRRVAEEAARRKALAEEAKRRADEEAAEREAEEAARDKALEDQAVQRAARELTRQPSLKPVEARVKTRLDVPNRSNRQGREAVATAARSRRQPGAPNYYSLRPFRNTQEIRTRVTQAGAAARKGFVIGSLALACLFILGGRYLGLPAARDISGASAMAVAPGSGPALLAGDRLLQHDRAGVGSLSITLEELGISTLAAPMLFNTAGELLAMAGPGTGGAPANGSEDPGLVLQRCLLEEKSCRPFSAQISGSGIGAMVEHPLTQALFLADLASGQLLKASSEGALLAGADVPLPPHPVLRIESGLLFMNSPNGPAISVLRYDDSAFGQQLDEILLLPPPAIAAEQTSVWDFVKVADNWWVTLHNPQTNSAGVYRFNEQWNYIDQAELSPGTWPQQLANWAGRLLVRDPGHLAVQRFSAQGEPEVPLSSDLLQDLALAQGKTRRLQGLAWRGGLALLAFIAVVGFCLGSLHRIRGLVYRSHRERGADPLEDIIEAVEWITPVPDRGAQILRTATAYGALALVILTAAITLGVSATQLSALLIALGGPAIALVILKKSPVGHIGILGKQLVLADHSDVYHLGSNARLQYRGGFLLIDDVVVFSGSRLLPAFSPEQIISRVKPLARAGIKVDRKTVLVKLLQARHPLARGALATVVCLLLAVALLAMQQ